MLTETLCKQCDGWGEIEKESKLHNCDSCNGDYFYDANGAPVNQRDRGYKLIKEGKQC